MTSAVRTAITHSAQALPFKDKLYMSYTYMFGCLSSIKVVSQDETGKPFVKFMETIFHPQGGGQPCDLGEFRIKSSKKIITVLDVQKEKIDGRADLFDVRHYVSPDDAGLLAVGQEISMQIDPNRRLLNARLHTCGHLIAALVADSRFPLIAKGGHHAPHEANVQFKFTSLVQETIEKKINDATSTVKNLSKKDIENIKNEVLLKLKTDVEAHLKQGLAKAIAAKLPVEILNSDTGREIQIGEYDGVPCGGTHLGSISEITEVFIRGITIKKDELKVSYGVSGENEASKKEKKALLS